MISDVLWAKTLIPFSTSQWDGSASACWDLPQRCESQFFLFWIVFFVLWYIFFLFWIVFLFGNGLNSLYWYAVSSSKKLSFQTHIYESLTSSVISVKKVLKKYPDGMFIRTLFYSIHEFILPPLQHLLFSFNAWHIPSLLLPATSSKTWTKPTRLCESSSSFLWIPWVEEKRLFFAFRNVFLVYVILGIQVEGIQHFVNKAWSNQNPNWPSLLPFRAKQCFRILSLRFSWVQW